MTSPDAAPSPGPSDPQDWSRWSYRSSVSGAAVALRVGILAAADPYRLHHARATAPTLPPEPLVSIPIATFDRPEVLLDRTLPAIASQTYANIEVLIIGDACPPNVADRLRRHQSKNLYFRNLRRRSRYPSDPVERWMVAGSRPRNVGSRMAKGDLLLWMSDDDELLPDGVERLVRAVATHDAEVSLGMAETGPLLDAGEPRVPFVSGVPAGKVWLARSYLGCFRWSRVSFLKAWNRPADYDIFARMQGSGVRFVGVDVPVCRIHPVPGTNSHGSKAWAERYGSQGSRRESTEGGG